MPFNNMAAIRAPTEGAVAPMMHPTNDNVLQPRTIHFLPKMSLSRPTSRKPIPDPRVQAVATQLMSGDGPTSALMRESVFAGKTQPRYAQMLAVQVAFHGQPIPVDIQFDTYNNRTDELRTAVVPWWHLIKVSSYGFGIDQIDCTIDVHPLHDVDIVKMFNLFRHIVTFFRRRHGSWTWPVC